MDNKFTKLMIDTANGYNAENYSVEDANTAIRNQFNKALGLEENATQKQIHRAIRRNKLTIFELIEDVLEDLRVSGWSDNPFYNQFVEIKNLAIGDRNEFYVEDNSMLVVSKFSGNHHDLLRQKLGVGETFAIPTSWYGVKIYQDFELMMAGRIDWAAFIQKIYQAWDNHVNGMIYKALMDSKDKLPSNFKKTGSLDAEKVDELATLVADEAGSEVVIMGTRTALQKLVKLYDANWISNEMKNERNTTGLVGYINGIRVVAIPQVYEPGTRNPMIDNKTLLFMPVRSDFKPIKLVNEGDAYFNEVADRETNVDMTIEAEYMQKIGVGVVLNLNYGIFSEIA